MLDGLRLPAASIALVALLAASVVDGLPVSEQSPLHPRAVPFTDVETSRTIPLALPGVLVGTAPAWQPVLQGAPNPPAPLQFRCPSTTTTQSVPDPRKDPTADRVEYGCPFRIYDQSPQIDPAGRPRTGFHFGNPQIVVNPSDEREIAFASLHGEPQQDGPTPRSRTGLPQTTFTTKDQGITWEDQYMNAVPAGGGQLGESDAITMDSHGNLYVGYLWSSANGNESTGYSSAIGLYKAATTHDAATVMQSYGNPFVYQSRTDRNPIDRLHLVYVAPYQPPPPTLSNETGNQTGAEAPASDDQVGQVTKSTNRSDERIVAVWHERAIDYRNSTTGYSAWIDAAVTTSQAKNDWQHLNSTQLIGPCRESSNPVAWNGIVYVACEVDNGYTARNRARIGDIDMWAIDPMTGNTTLVAPTFLLGGHPTLAVTPDGYMALVTVAPDEDRGAHVFVAYGWYGRGWDRRGDLGPILHQMAGGFPSTDAQVTGLAISQNDKTAALVYMEWQKGQGPAPAQPTPTLPDPNNPAAPTPHLTDYKKVVATFNECQFPIAASAMQLGTGIDPANLQAYQDNPAIFDDFQDGLVSYREPNGEDLYYFAINDYGAMQFGAIVASSASGYCPITPPLVLPAPPALPQALTVSSTATTAVGAVIGVAALAMVTYLLTVKRRVAQFATAEDKE